MYEQACNMNVCIIYVCKVGMLPVGPSLQDA